MADRYVRLLPILPGPFAVSLVLADAEAADATDSGFIMVGPATSSARHYRAVLVSESGAKLADLVVKLPPDEMEEGFFPGEVEETGNAIVEARWDRVLADLARLQGAPGYFPDLVLPNPSGLGSVGKLLQPLLFCPTTGRLFPIPCPTCLGELRTWRDDQALATAGLPVHSATTTRLLHCPTCASAGRPVRAWVAAVDGPGELAARGVGDIVELRRGLSDRLAKARGAGEELPSWLACNECQDIGDCLGIRDGDRAATGKRKVKQVSAVNWTVFNSSDCPFLVTRLVPLGYDEMVDRLGGRVAGDDPAAPPAGGFLFSDEGSGVDAVEVLSLKLVAFLQLVRAVREYYARLVLPHLDIQPDHVAVEPGSGGAYLPDLWSFRVKLLSGSSSRLCRLGETVELVLPPRELVPPYAAPAIGELAQSASRRAELIVDKLLAEPDGVKVRLEGRLGDANGLYPRPGSRDFIVLAVPEDVEGLGGRSIVTMLDPRGSRSGGGTAVTSEPITVDAALAKRLQKAGGLRLGLVRYRVYPRLGVDEDCYSLGVMLLRTLLVNDRQDLDAVFATVTNALRQSRGDQFAARRVGQLVDEAVKAATVSSPLVLSKANIFYREADRDPSRVNAVPDEAWQASLHLAFALLDSRLAGWSSGDASVTDPAPLDRALREGEAALRSLLGVLFRRQIVNAEIQGVIAELLAETTS